jgi:membrane carboxypeptidase/penicillin-binding protein PbpC
MFGRQCSELSFEQAATIIALTKVPGYAGKPEKLAQLRDSLLKRYAART